MQNAVNEIIKRHKLLVIDIDKAILKANELFNDNLTYGSELFTDKLSSAAAGIYITYMPALVRAEDYQRESKSYALTEYPDTDNILLKYLSPKQQEVAKLYVMNEFFKFQVQVAIGSGLVDKDCAFEVQSGKTQNGQTRYRMQYV